MKAKYLILLCVLTSLCSCTRRSNSYGDSCVKQTITHATSNIESTHTENNRITRSDVSKRMTASEIFDRYNSAVFMVFTSDGWNNFQGSGFFINQYGLAVSNYHVFEGTGIGLETVKLSNGLKCKVKEVVAKSKEYDYIIFKVAISTSCNYIPVSNHRNKVGEKVFTIGSPRGLENTFSSGEISQLRGDYLIQINAPIDHGSSGGALINEYGEAIGITTAGLDNSGANLNFALDIAVLKPNLGAAYGD